MTAVLRPRPELGTPATWNFPDFTDSRLGNGLRLMTLHRPGKQIATVALVLDVPADADPAGLEGTAAIAARALNEGTQDRSVDEFADALERHGAGFGADAGYAGLTATLDVPVTRLESAFGLLCEAVTRPAFDPGEVDRVVKQRLAEIARERSNPPSRARVEFGAALHTAGSRRATPVAGTEASIAALSGEGVAAHYFSRASAAGSTLLIAGDLSGIDVSAMVENGLGGWTGASVSPWPPSEPSVVTGPRAVVVDRPDAVQTQVVIGHGSPDRRSPEWAAMALAAYALGGTLTSRIDAVLREEKGYTYGMRARFAPDRRGGTFAISGSFDTANSEPALDDLARILRTAVAEGLRQDERDAASEFLAGVSPTRWETPDSLVRQAATLVGCDLPVSWVNEYLNGLRNATLDEVNTALRSHIRPDELVVVAVGAAEQITGPLERLGFGKPEILPA